jgi:hypothetical protein
VAIDATTLVPLFITGCAAQLPPDGFRSSAPWLARLFSRLRSHETALCVTPWARRVLDVLDTPTVDELRLRVTSRAALPGLLGLEVGVAWNPTRVGWVMAPEVLVRVSVSSPAASKLGHDLPEVASLPGRVTDERVVRVRPKAPTILSTAALVRDLVGALATPAPSPRRKPPLVETAGRPPALHPGACAQPPAQLDVESESPFGSVL